MPRIVLKINQTLDALGAMLGNLGMELREISPKEVKVQRTTSTRLVLFDRYAVVVPKGNDEVTVYEIATKLSVSEAIEKPIRNNQGVAHVTDKKAGYEGFVGGTGWGGGPTV